MCYSVAGGDVLCGTLLVASARGVGGAGGAGVDAQCATLLAGGVGDAGGDMAVYYSVCWTCWTC